MFELSIAWKYLLPKRRQLSVSIISVISVLVISLVVWLILVFFSVTKGLEKGWIDKLVALTSPVRITPTEEYFNSYYYQIDQLSSKSGFSPRSIQEKRIASVADPYNPELDEEIPEGFPKPDMDETGELKDLVKLAFSGIEKLGLKGADYEITTANIRLRLVRGKVFELTQAFLTQPVYLVNFDPENRSLSKSVLPFTERDVKNAFSTLLLSNEEELLDAPQGLKKLKPPLGIARQEEMSQGLGMVGRPNLDETGFNQYVVALNEKVFESENPRPFYALYKSREKGNVVHNLPIDTLSGFGVLVPKSFREAGVLLGDRGYINYFSPTASGIQEQRVGVFIAGFYDPGIVSVGGKFILADKGLVSTIRGAQGQEGAPLTNGIHVYLSDIAKADTAKEQLLQEFRKAGIDRYFKIETFREFEFAKDLLQQLSSERNIFSLIAIVIIIVACSNIVSMLIILVKDKKSEIGILRAMGASKGSIAAIFGTAGVVMGFFGTVLGTALAYFTLRHLNDLLGLISKMQGYAAFNPLFYGERMPSELSLETLGSLFAATAIISLISGLIPALMATRINPAEILRSE